MSYNLVQRAFIAGELSPTLFGRTDLERYELGLALAYNWYVDYRGGVSTRPGSIFGDYIQYPDRPSKFFKFKFGPGVANTMLLLFGDGYVRFIQDNAYVVEDDVALTGISQGTPGVVTSVGHSFVTGDWVYLNDVVGMTEVNGRLFEVGTTTANTFELKDPLGAPFSTASFGAYVSGGVINRVYTISHPYAAEDLATLRADQNADYVRLTHPDYRIRNLIRRGQTDWVIEEEQIGNGMTPPTGLTHAIVPTTTNNEKGAWAWGVTSVDDEGNESVVSDYDFILFSDNARDYSSVRGHFAAFWNPVPGAKYYNVYRTLIFPRAFEEADSALTRGTEMGYIGRSFAPSFYDNNIVPDFSKQPPEHNDPFADGRIERIEVTSGGSGYTRTSTMTITDNGPGTGAVGVPIVNADGVIIAVVLLNKGRNYADPQISVSDGTGASFDVELGPSEGNNPSFSLLFQQRQVYLASRNNPLRIWGSKVGLFSNFDVSSILNAGDSYEFDISSDQISPLKSALEVQGGLLLFSGQGVWLLRGEEGRAVSPLSAIIDPQTKVGASDLLPLAIGSDILYMEQKSSTVRMLQYSDLAKVYSGQDMSVLSNHFFSAKNPVENWDYADTPFHLVWAQRADGSLLTFTHVPEQNVEAWTQHWTKGLFTDVIVVDEDGEDAVYVAVKRYVNGRWVKFFERMHSRIFSHVEDAWCVDCGLTNVRERPDATLTASATEGDAVTFTASSGVFAAGDVGKVIYMGGGKAEITGFTNAAVVTAKVLRPITKVLPEDTGALPLSAAAGEWEMVRPLTTVGGLWHLEGETVSILADGNVIPPRTVVNGQVSLPAPATKVIVGLPYKCRGVTLPLATTEATIEGRRKRLVGITARVNETRGLRFGASFDKMYAMKDRSNESYGEAIRLRSDSTEVLVDAVFDVNGQTYFEQLDPLPATVLGFVFDVEIGDDLD